MANDKNPTEQLRTRIPATHSERNFDPSADEATLNPWDALQSHPKKFFYRSSRFFQTGSIDFSTILVWLCLCGFVVGLILLLI